MAKDEVVVRFVWVRDTKNKARYDEVGEEDIVGALYVRKGWAAGAKRLRVVIQKEK